MLVQTHLQDLEFEDAFKARQQMEGCIDLINRHSSDIESIYTIIQLEAQIMAEKGMYLDASHAYLEI